METESALVGSYCGIKLYTESVINLHLTLVIDPGNPEKDHSLRSHYPFKERLPAVFLLILFDHCPE